MSQTKGSDLLPDEKQKLKQSFKEEKHHVVVAMNIFLYLHRHGMLEIDALSNGKKFQWNK
jgi:hypothetical protein